MLRRDAYSRLVINSTNTFFYLVGVSCITHFLFFVCYPSHMPALPNNVAACPYVILYFSCKWRIVWWWCFPCSMRGKSSWCSFLVVNFNAFLFIGVVGRDYASVFVCDILLITFYPIVDNTRLRIFRSHGTCFYLYD